MIKSTIANYLHQNSKTLGSLLTKLNQLKQWNSWLKDCLGEEGELIKHCQIVNLSGTSLIAVADSPHWIIRLRFHIPELLPKLRTYPGLEKIKAICCKTQPNYITVKPKKRRNRQKLSAQAAASLCETARKVQDEKLGKILERIAGHAQGDPDKS